MKYFISFFLIVLIVIISCNTQNQDSDLFSQKNLPTEKFTINTDRDTVLQTGNGALLKIMAGSLENKNGKTVNLEIKEAYSMQQIVSAGLFTQSNGQALSSGGMIYINAAAGQEVTFKQKIQVAIPADYLQKGMELYKGEEKADGSINWINPDTLPENKQLTSAEKGKILFESRCRSCHQIGKDATGPNLAQFVARFSGNEDDLKYYFHRLQLNFMNQAYNSHENVDTNYRHFDDLNVYKCNLEHIFGLVATSFPMLENEDTLLNVFNYIQNESDRQNLPYPKYSYLKGCVDSCEAYFNKTVELKYIKSLSQKEQEKLIKENGEMTNLISDTTWPINNNPITPGDFDRKVSPRNFNATYYQFEVSSFGWLNIDMLLNDVEGVKESELFVRITGEYTKRVNLFLIIPSHKVYGEGGPADGKVERYAFFKKDGTIPLPQGVKAYILAISEQDDKIAFGLKEFTTGLKQEIELSLKASTKEQLDAAVKSFDAQRLHIKVSETVNADSIRKKDKEIKDIDIQLKDAESLKPKNCECDCGSSFPGTNKDTSTFELR